MSAPQHKLLSITVHCQPTPRRFVLGEGGVKGIEVVPTPSGHHRVTVLLEDGRYIGYHAFPVEIETELQSILTPTGVKLT